MRQAIEEGFILDVLRNYTSYKTAFNLAHEGKVVTEVDRGGAIKGIMGWVRLHEYYMVCGRLQGAYMDAIKRKARVR